MILNDKHRFVFVHIPKTAGTSVSKALEALDGRNTEAMAKTKHETPMDLFGFFADCVGWRFPVQVVTTRDVVS